MKVEELTLYRELVGDIKARVRQAQHRAALSANAEMIRMYWDVGLMIAARQKEVGWGTGVIPRLAADLTNELPELKGFSERNIKQMLRFYQEYSQVPAGVPHGKDQLKPQENETSEIVPQPVAQLKTLFALPIVQQSIAQLPWAPADPLFIGSLSRFNLILTGRDHESEPN